MNKQSHLLNTSFAVCIFVLLKVSSTERNDIEAGVLKILSFGFLLKINNIKGSSPDLVNMISEIEYLLQPLQKETSNKF